MKKLISISFLFTTLVIFSQDKICSDYKIGEFAYVNVLPHTTIIRTENKQIETNFKTGVEIYSSIEWTSDCEYILTCQEILNTPEDASYMIGQKIYVEIIETHGKKYKVRAKNSLFDTNLEFIKKE